MLLYLGDYGDVDISRSIGREEVFCALDPTDTNQVETSHFFSFDRRFIYSFKCRHALWSFPEGQTHWLLYATHISRLQSMRTKIVKHICIFCKFFCKLSCLCKWVMHTQVLVRGFFSVGRTTHPRACMQGKTVSSIYCSGLGTTFNDVDVELETTLKDDFVERLDISFAIR